MRKFSFEDENSLSLYYLLREGWKILILHFEPPTIDYSMKPTSLRFQSVPVATYAWNYTVIMGVFSALHFWTHTSHRNLPSKWISRLHWTWQRVWKSYSELWELTMFWLKINLKWKLTTSSKTLSGKPSRSNLNIFFHFRANNFKLQNSSSLFLPK